MDELAFIEKFVRENGDYIREKFSTKQELTVTSKATVMDLLTEVDLTVQKRFVEQVEKHYPGDLVVGEEGEFSRHRAERTGRCWVIDPIDGTNNFVRGLFPIFCVSIAFAVDGLADAAGVYLPIGDTCFTARRGAGSFYETQRLAVSGVQHIEEASVHFDLYLPADRKKLLSRAGELLRGAGQVRCHGSAAVSMCEIALGQAEAYIHQRLHPWDFAAAQLIVEEAGGMATHLDGSPLHIFDGEGSIAVSNGAIHEELLAALK